MDGVTFFLLVLIIIGGLKMALDLSVLAAEVTEIGGTVDSAIALIQALADKIENNIDDPAALQALVDELNAKQEALAAAVAANND
jgi:hypothetical protein